MAMYIADVPQGLGWFRGSRGSLTTLVNINVALGMLRVSTDP
jgi:hypothetical protein